MAQQLIDIGTLALDGADGDTLRENSTKNNENATELYNQLGANAQGVLPAALPLTKGGTGATTAAAAHTALGLGTAAIKNVGTWAGNVMEVGAFGVGLRTNTAYLSPTTDLADVPNGFYGLEQGGHSGLLIRQSGGVGATKMGILGFPSDAGVSAPFYYQINLVNGANMQSQQVYRHIFRTTQNTVVDGSGFIKNASPVVKLFSDYIELNHDAEKQDITFEKLGVGDYLIKGSLGFAQEGWTFESPVGSNKDLKVFSEYGTHDNGDIWVKTYEPVGEGWKAQKGEPLDIIEGRWIDLRLHEEPPVIAERSEDLDISKPENQQETPNLTRRQLRLALVLNNFDLDNVEILINAIVDPVKRQIVKIEWQDSTEFTRTNPSLLFVFQLIGLTADDINNLWTQALSL